MQTQPNTTIKSVEIQNYFSLANVALTGLSRTKEVYFLGENGDGKTILLQGILLAFLKYKIQNETSKEAVGRILEYLEENPDLAIKATDSNGFEYGDNENHLKNIYAYGSNRNRSNASKYAEKEGYLTLFYDDKTLLSPIEWLKDVRLEEIDGNATFTLKQAIALLEDLLDKNVKISLTGKKVTFKDIRFTERETEGLRFEQLSDGYKSVMTWVADLVARMAENQPKAKRIEDFKGIVLVDEVGLHLHSKWEAGLVQKLRKWFPKVQFFFSTHSPIMILNADKSAVFYRLYKEEGVTKISDKFYCKDFSDLRLNSLVTSPLFDLEDASMRSFDPETDDSDTSEDFMTSRIRKLVREKMANLKAENKVVLSVDFLDDLIKSAMEQID
jgi:predicted ATP-binding protein involved in virulence